MPHHLSIFSSQFSSPPAARHYHPTLSIWLSVDPMSDKYPGVSPYTYCANNPVRLVDKDGRDWFENEETGDVYYARDYRKGDEHLIDGTGWKWMGGNDMFGRSADEVIYSNYQKVEAEIYTGDESIGRAAYKGDNAKNFMQLMGYKSVPTQVITYDNTYSYSMSDGMHTFHFTVGVIADYTEKSSYVPVNYSESCRKQVGKAIYGKRDIFSGQFPQVSRNHIFYSKTRDLSPIANFIKGMFGYHNYVDHINRGRLSYNKLEGAEGALVKKILKN